MKGSANINISVRAATTATAVLMVVLLLSEANVSVNTVVCNPTELSVCSGAISSNTPPSAECCTKIKQQQPCLCQYLKNPSVGKLINTPAAKKVASTCGVPIPKC